MLYFNQPHTAINSGAGTQVRKTPWGSRLGLALTLTPPSAQAAAGMDEGPAVLPCARCLESARPSCLGTHPPREFGREEDTGEVGAVESPFPGVTKASQGGFAPPPASCGCVGRHV